MSRERTIRRVIGILLALPTSMLAAAVTSAALEKMEIGILVAAAFISLAFVYSLYLIFGKSKQSAAAKVDESLGVASGTAASRVHSEILTEPPVAISERVSAPQNKSNSKRITPFLDSDAGQNEPPLPASKSDSIAPAVLLICAGCAALIYFNWAKIVLGFTIVGQVTIWIIAWLWMLICATVALKWIVGTFSGSHHAGTRFAKKHIFVPRWYMQRDQAARPSDVGLILGLATSGVMFGLAICIWFLGVVLARKVFGVVLLPSTQMPF